MATQPESALSHLECPLCGRRHEADILQNLCHDCDKPLLARYDLSSAARALSASGWLHPEETVLLFNTGSGHKHAHLWPGGA